MKFVALGALLVGLVVGFFAGVVASEDAQAARQFRPAPMASREGRR